MDITNQVPPRNDDTALLFRDHGARVRRWASRLVGSSGDADDLVQEVFLAAYKHQQAHGPLQSPGPWLLKVASNLARHFWRSRGRQADRDLSWDRVFPPCRPADPLEQFEIRCAAQRLDQALAGLDHRQAQVYVLSEVQELPAATVAAMTGIQPGTLRVRRFRARSAVARKLALMQARDDEMLLLKVGPSSLDRGQTIPHAAAFP